MTLACENRLDDASLRLAVTRARAGYAAIAKATAPIGIERTVGTPRSAARQNAGAPRGSDAGRGRPTPRWIRRWGSNPALHHRSASAPLRRSVTRQWRTESEIGLRRGAVNPLLVDGELGCCVTRRHAPRLTLIAGPRLERRSSETAARRCNAFLLRCLWPPVEAGGRSDMAQFDGRDDGTDGLAARRRPETPSRNTRPVPPRSDRRGRV